MRQPGTSSPGEAKSEATPAAIRAIDLFCGAGGSSWGAKQAGVQVVAAFDLWELAGKNHHENFPDTEFIHGRLEDSDPHALAKRFGKIDLIMASPECTNHSPAKGNAPRCEVSKDTAFQVIRYAKAFQPRWIVIENVINMLKWTRYQEFYQQLADEGYQITEQKLNAADFGVPQSRRRLFLLCDKLKKPDSIIKLAGDKVPASSFINLNGKFRWTPVDKPKRAEATLARAKRGREKVKRNAFLMVYYGSDGSGGWQKMSRPLRTVTTVDRFAVVKRENGLDVMRMLQPDELTIAMGMDGMAFRHGSRREKIHMLGNAVCPPVMRVVIYSLTASQ